MATAACHPAQADQFRRRARDPTAAAPATPPPPPGLRNLNALYIPGRVSF